MPSQIQETIPVRQAIEDRRSIRKYVQETINGDDLEEILRLTCLAPSAWNVQPWRFHVVVDPDVKQQLRAAAYDQPQVTLAPAVVVVTSDMEDVLAHLEEIAHPGPGMPPGGGWRLAPPARPGPDPYLSLS